MADLADDMADWPSDPYELLGVVPGTEARRVRKAYSELIRRFKPERFPEQFRRIREAFEQVQATEAWRALREASKIPDDVAAAAPMPISAAPPRSADPDQLWDAACAGEHDRVYRELRERVGRGGEPESTYLQLYWLRTAFPEVDPDVRPIDWAIRAIADGHEQGRSYANLHTELVYRGGMWRDPALVRLADAVRSAEAAARLFELRWSAAIRGGQWTLVLDEFDAARSRLHDQPAHWTRLLGWVVGHLAWRDDDHLQRAFEAGRSEIETLAVGNRSMDPHLERLDFLVELVRQWRQMPTARPLHRGIEAFLPISWHGTLGEMRWKLIDIYRVIGGNVVVALDHLDGLAASAPLVVNQLVVAAHQTYFSSFGNVRAEPDDVRAVFEKLGESAYRDRLLRVDLLDFLLREHVLVDDFLNCVPVREIDESLQVLLDQLAGDMPLRLVNIAQLTLETGR